MNRLIAGEDRSRQHLGAEDRTGEVTGRCRRSASGLPYGTSNWWDVGRDEMALLLLPLYIQVRLIQLSLAVRGLSWLSCCLKLGAKRNTFLQHDGTVTSTNSLEDVICFMTSTSFAWSLLVCTWIFLPTTPKNISGGKNLVAEICFPSLVYGGHVVPAWFLWLQMSRLICSIHLIHQPVEYNRQIVSTLISQKWMTNSRINLMCANGVLMENRM